MVDNLPYTIVSLSTTSLWFVILSVTQTEVPQTIVHPSVSLLYSLVYICSLIHLCVALLVTTRLLVLR